MEPNQKNWQNWCIRYSCDNQHMKNHPTIYFERGMGVVGYLKKSKYWWRNVHRKMGAFFVRFVAFTSTLVCSVVWDQSIGVPLGGILTMTSNISYLVKGWSNRSISNVGRVEIFVPVIGSEAGNHPLPIFLLCSSNFTD